MFSRIYLIPCAIELILGFAEFKGSAQRSPNSTVFPILGFLIFALRSPNFSDFLCGLRCLSWLGTQRETTRRRELFLDTSNWPWGTTRSWASSLETWQLPMVESCPISTTSCSPRRPVHQSLLLMKISLLVSLIWYKSRLLFRLELGFESWVSCYVCFSS